MKTPVKTVAKTLKAAKIPGCLLLLLLALPASGMAGEITLFSGVQNPGKLTLSAVGSPGITNPANAGVLGVRYKHGGFIGLEHTLAYVPNFIDDQSKGYVYSSNFIVSGPAVGVRPYITAGLGTVIGSGSGPSDIGAKFALNYGIGAKVRVLGPLVGRFDFRGYTVPGVQSQSLRLLETSFGLVFSN